jgi:hypothetical protein
MLKLNNLVLFAFALSPIAHRRQDAGAFGSSNPVRQRSPRGRDCHRAGDEAVSRGDPRS